MKVTRDDLLAALGEAQVPGPEWMTFAEIVKEKGWSETTARRRISAMERAGRVERMRAPRRSDGLGLLWYYRLKKGKP